MGWVGGADGDGAAWGWGLGGDCAVVLFALPHFFLWVGVISSQLGGRGGDECPTGGSLF